MTDVPRQAPAPPSSPPHAAFRDAVLAKIRRDLAAEAEVSERLRSERLPRLSEIVAAARDEGICREVFLFGSYAWGNPTARSDLDLLVAGDADELAWRVGSALGCEVDAWELDRAPPALIERARTEGISL